MPTLYRYAFLLIAVLLPLLNGCCRTRQDVWDDTKSCGRHVMRGLRSLGGQQSDSKQVRSRDEFMPADLEDCQGHRLMHPSCAVLPEEYPADELAMVDYSSRRQRTNNPEVGSCADNFPSNRESWRSSFSNIRFPYNSDLVKGSEHLLTIRQISDYLKGHPKAYVMIEGHCDERGAEAYNLSLGLRRANTVRSLLVQEGVHPSRLQTVSYGKERPLDTSSNEEAWSKNRRAQFKICER